MRLNFQNYVFLLGKSRLFCHSCIQTLKDEIQNQVYKSNDQSIALFSLFISVQAEKHLTKSKAQFREKLRKLRPRQNEYFLISKPVLRKQKNILLKFMWRVGLKIQKLV